MIRRGVRLIPPASVLLCLAQGDWVSAMVMLLVCLGTTICWRLRPVARFEIGFNLTLLLAAWSSVWLLYERWAVWDLVIHFLATAHLSVLAMLLVDRWRPRTPTSQAGVTIGAGAVLCLVWEAMELMGFLLVDDSIEIHPWDTFGDVVAGMLGAIVAAWLVPHRVLAGVEAGQSVKESVG